MLNVGEMKRWEALRRLVTVRMTDRSDGMIQFERSRKEDMKCQVVRAVRRKNGFAGRSPSHAFQLIFEGRKHLP